MKKKGGKERNKEGNLGNFVQFFPTKTQVKIVSEA